MDTVKPSRRKVTLDLDILDVPSSPESPSRRPAFTRKPSFKNTFDTILRSTTKKPAQDPTGSTPDLSCGESSQSEESAPSTPRTVHSSLSLASIDPESERRERERRESFDRQETVRDRSQFQFRRQYIPHHRFPREEVPYMQSYSHVALHKYVVSPV